MSEGFAGFLYGVGIGLSAGITTARGVMASTLPEYFAVLVPAVAVVCILAGYWFDKTSDTHRLAAAEPRHQPEDTNE